VPSWHGLFRLSPINSYYLQCDYHTMSQVAAGGFAAQSMELSFSSDRALSFDELLGNLYGLAAVYISVADSLMPGSDVDFSELELACLQRELDKLEELAKEPVLADVD
jgi:hypothetical protein